MKLFFFDSRETNSYNLLSLAANELDSGFELALRELVDVVRFGRFKQLVEQCVLAEKKGKEEK